MKNGTKTKQEKKLLKFNFIKRTLLKYATWYETISLPRNIFNKIN